MEGFRLLELAGAAAMTRWCVVALAGLLSAVKAWASPSDAFFPLNQAIAVIADSPRGESLSKEVDALRTVVQKLEDRFVASQLQVPDDYKKTLNFDASLLRMASESKGGKAEVELLNEVLEDLRAKDVASQGKGMQAGIASMSPLIRVTITTTNSGTPAHGYLVRCNRRRFAEAAIAMFVFNKPSSPTSYEMPPGMYVCTAALSGNVRGKQAVSVGLAGADHEDVTIAMP